MAIDKLELVYAAREQLTELPESNIFSRENLIGLIPAAVALWQERTLSDTNKRHNFIQTSNSIAINQGKADLSGIVDDLNFRLDYLTESDISIEYDRNPQMKVVFVSSLDRLRLGGRQDKFFILAYLSGKELYFRDPAAPEGADPTTTLYGTFKVRGIVLPGSLDELAPSLKGELALVLAELSRAEFMQQNKGLNFQP